MTTLIATALLVLSAPQKLNPVEVIAQLDKTYSKIKSAKMTVKVASVDKDPAVTTTLQFEAPNRLWSHIVPGYKDMPAFTYVSDGKRVQSIGRPGYGVKPFNLQSIQDDGPPVYKETLLLWDRRRQLFGKTKGFGFAATKEKRFGKSWIVLREDTANRGERYEYFIEPKSGLIKLTQMYVNGQPAMQYVVMSQEINVPVNRKLFAIKPK